MKKILILYPGETATKHGIFEGFAADMQKILGEGTEVLFSTLRKILFDISNAGVVVLDTKNNVDLGEYDLVVFALVGRSFDVASAVAMYLKNNGVRFVDSYIGHAMPDNKLNSTLLQVYAGNPVPRTIYGPVEAMAERMGELGEKVVCKDVLGKKGRNNYLVSSVDELRSIVEANGDVNFVMQQFVPNDGDLRVLVLDGKVGLVLERRGSGKTHLNNTSVGGMAEIVEVSDEVKKIAESGAKVEKLEVAGVDVIVDKNTGKPYILEVYREPQMATGTFLEEKKTVYAKFLEAML